MSTSQHDPNVRVTITSTEYIPNGRTSQFGTTFGARPKPAPHRTPDPAVFTAIIAPCKYDAEGELIIPDDETIRTMWDRRPGNGPGYYKNEPYMKQGYVHLMWQTTTSTINEQDARSGLMRTLGGHKAAPAFRLAHVIREKVVWTPDRVDPQAGQFNQPGTLSFFRLYAYETPERTAARAARAKGGKSLLNRLKRTFGGTGANAR